MSLIMQVGLVAALVCGPGTGLSAQEDAGRRVTATGRAVGTGETAVEEARLDALREAVRQVCGAFINAQTETEDFAVIRDRILEQPVGIARIVKVVRGPEVIAGEITEIQIEAEVFPARFEQRWAEFAHIREREGNPRCVVIVTEDDDVTDDRPATVNGPVQAEIEGFFLSKKVRLVDKGVTDDVKRRDLEMAALSGDVNKAAAAAGAFKAEVLVLGQAEARPGDPVVLGGQTLRRWSLSLTVRVIQADSGAILVSHSYTPQTGAATASGNSRNALIRLAKESAPDLLTRVGRAWRERATVSRVIEVAIEPCSHEQLRLIEARLAEQKGVVGGREGIRRRGLENEIATIEVDWKYNPDQLADRFSEMKVPVDGGELTLTVKGQNANRLGLRLDIRPATPPASGPG